jgi:hypothetical protein
METREELILKFMLAQAGTNYYAKRMAESLALEMEQAAKDMYLAAAIFADRYLNRA